MCHLHKMYNMNRASISEYTEGISLNFELRSILVIVGQDLFWFILFPQKKHN
jgi:hypothetical protein